MPSELPNFKVPYPLSALPFLLSRDHGLLSCPPLLVNFHEVTSAIAYLPTSDLVQFRPCLQYTGEGDFGREGDMGC